MPIFSGVRKLLVQFRGFCVGKKNWVMFDTIAGAKSSAIIYSVAETAIVNSLKPYEYLNIF